MCLCYLKAVLEGRFFNEIHGISKACLLAENQKKDVDSICNANKYFNENFANLTC